MVSKEGRFKLKNELTVCCMLLSGQQCSQNSPSFSVHNKIGLKSSHGIIVVGNCVDSSYLEMLLNFSLLDLLSNNKQLIIFPGMHVVLIMFTGYLVGYAAFRALFNHSAVMVISESTFTFNRFF